ncbi:hypothetical protein [Nocardioides nanhaiensis]|uniref:Bacteriocin biosynthesis cyclodehydratase domain-containing protein n=1 Tax=Nocardioides nanhaiensis TaxID=1476871 RepID=A0ABP8W2X0_9ACTN
MGPDPRHLLTASTARTEPEGDAVELLLRPGWFAVRRDDRTLQVGLDAPHRALLPDIPPVRALLARLTGPGWTPPGAGEPHPDPATTHALATLGEADLLVDSRATRADAARHGAAAATRATARSAGSVAVRGPGELRRQAESLLVAAGVRVHRDGDIDEPLLHVLLHTGEPDRAALADLVREDRPHLLVVAREACLEVGPLVAPGLTACQRCVDCHRAETDPRRHLVVEQLARAAAAGAIVPADPVLWQLALAWAARDAARYLEGDAPATWSAGVVVTAGGVPHVQHWPRHPACGCAWQVGLDHTG